MKKEIILSGDKLSIEEIIAIAKYNAKVIIPEKSVKRVQENWDAITEMLERGDTMYGLNTGIGGFGNVKISKNKAGELSTRMLKAHSAGYGDIVKPEIAKATLLLRTNLFTKGYSGVRPKLIRTMTEMINKNVIPVFYNKGSVGTSGDLAPLSQMGLVIIGEGKAYYQGKIMSGKQAMKKAEIPLLTLAYREGLAIMNGTQYMSALAAFNVYDAERLIKQLEIICSMTIDVLNCVESAYSQEYNAVKGYGGQNDSAWNLRKLIKGSEIMQQKKKNVALVTKSRARTSIIKVK